MDAPAYLKRQGWKGDGHSLDAHGRGIRKPLLVSKKVDVLGLGVNKHAAVSDQWWMRAFDQSLKDLGTGKDSALAAVQKHGIHHGSLYGRFVKGEGMPGTIGESSIPMPPPAMESAHPAPTPATDAKTQATPGVTKKPAQSKRRQDKSTKVERKLEKAERRYEKAAKALANDSVQPSTADAAKLRRRLDQARLKLKRAKRGSEKPERKRKKARKVEAVSGEESKRNGKEKRGDKHKRQKLLRQEKRGG